MSSDKLKPFQSLMDELAAPENRPLAPRLDPAFKQQLRHRLLDQGATKLSGQAMVTLWKFGLTAVFIIVLGGALLSLWLVLSRPPETLAPVVEELPSPTPTQTLIETPLPTPTVSSMVANAPKPFFWKTTGAFPMTLMDGLVAESLTIDRQFFALGETAVFTITYSTTEELSGNYTSFVHLFNNAGELVASVDKPLGHTSGWIIGQPTAKTYELLLPDHIDHAPLQLSLGLYNFATGEQLVIDDELDTPIATIVAGLLIERTTGRINRDNVAMLTEPNGEQHIAVLAEGMFVTVETPANFVTLNDVTWQQVRLFGTNEVGWIPSDALGRASGPAEEYGESSSSLDCPVTLPPMPPFTPPDPFPKQPPAEFSWYGDEQLWTVVPNDQTWRSLPRDTDGGFSQKVVWWNKGYNPLVEPKPPLLVIGRRLDGDAPELIVTDATNGFNPESGNFMLVGITLPTAGCWEIMGQYKDKTLSFVVQVIP